MRYLVYTLALFLIFSSAANAQSNIGLSYTPLQYDVDAIQNMTGIKSSKKEDSKFLERAQAAAGASLAFVPVNYPISNEAVFDALPPFYNGITLSGNYVFWHQDDFISVSTTTGLTFAFSASQNFGVSMLAQIPAYGFFRLGANATPYNENKVGFGVGAGLNFTHARFPLSTDGWTQNGEGRANYVSPAALAELTFNFSGNPFTIRYQMNLMQSRGELRDIRISPTETTDVAVDYSFWSLGLIYYFY